MKPQRVFPLVILAVLLLTLWSMAVNVTIDGTAVDFTAETGIPYVDENSRTLVPLRAVMETYGCRVDWENDTRTAAVVLDGVTVRVPVGSSTYTISDSSFSMDTAAVIREGRTYLPIRYVLEAFGAQVDWDGTTATVAVRHREYSDLQVHFLDVGQADAILITDGTDAMLVDAGNNDDGTAVVQYLTAHGIRHLCYAVGTHPHEDHIGGLDTVLEAIPTDALLLSAATADSKTYRDVLLAAEHCGLPPTVPETGTAYTLGDSEFTVVSDLETDDANNASLMLRLVRGETSFLLTGDAEAPAEEAALQTGLTLDSDVLKVGHHASRSSTSKAFLDAVTPISAVISCGEGNSYGHPHEETLATLTGIDLYRTDLQGTILVTSDGHTLRFSTVPAVTENASVGYVLNTNTMKFHLPDCGSVKTIQPDHRQESFLLRAELIALGYAPCGSCKP